MASLQRRQPGRSNVRRRNVVGFADRSHRKWGFLIIWEFQVRAGKEKRFEKVYGPDGDWARLFAQDESYIGTELMHNLKTPLTYATLDFWTSEQAYKEFRSQNRAQYKTLDLKCEALTENEREIGSFVKVLNE